MTNNFNSVRAEFLYGEEYEYEIIPLKKVHRCNDVPGLYAWHLRIPSDNCDEGKLNLEKYASVYQSKSLIVQAKAPFNTVFCGEIEQSETSVKQNENASLTRIARHISAVFAPPLYIGLSTKIESRLQSHKKKLKRFLRRSQGSTIGYESSDTFPDSESESSVFAKRIGTLLASNGVEDARGLYAKVIYLESIDVENLKILERYFNEVYTPLMGRR